MSQLMLSLAAVLGLVAVALGAFAAHGLKHTLADNLLSAFNTGVEYQMYHALALIGVALFIKAHPGPWLTACGALFFVGTLLFSGSLYALALTGARWLGPITPLGGLCFMLGWACLFIAAIKYLK
ncbi:DUF423 domain-containing protein [Gilvimarinus sp. SDUM040013]|uniref:DUF423 domain-containing protein n=1 Tax=Gilvimarinus gilvus TaxID=3058038 RepID=A0ABU4RZ42_9GAMM|nr:DUF423 domain-containing protein [Gilvimarinus sp. SDUM040013]MDO3387566.1 DUF423 domain-containing protein [Gilvimarinus sp. SDUM040013]MDX6850169.1 DUF423 domain-containing protein [Gilvimarinus sp. SDUM040013]